jgi:ZIP family zinc transporter
VPVDNFFIALSVCIGAALATMLGGLSVVTARRLSPRLLAFGLAFAGGAMVYISLVEIFWKSHSSFQTVFEADRPAYIAATLAFFAGAAVLALLERFLPLPHVDSAPLGEESGLQLPTHRDPHETANLQRIGVLTALAITGHNIPEGLATFFATLENPSVGMSLAVAFAVHNIPEGVSISIPIYFATGSRRLALLVCLGAAAAEPLGALLGYFLLAPYLGPMVFGIVFGFLAGVMVFLSLDHIIPAAKRYASGHDVVYGMLCGMSGIALSLVLFR